MVLCGGFLCLAAVYTENFKKKYWDNSGSLKPPQNLNFFLKKKSQ
jgi:hypothetical protein